MSRTPALTLVDGSLASVYPTEDAQIVTLSSVPHTPVGRCATAGEVHALRAAVNRDLVLAKCLAMEDQISANLPTFRERFRFMGIQLAIKTKPAGGYDDRSCYVFRDGRVFSVMSGKIDTIFFATERVLSMIEADHSDTKVSERPSALRDSILTHAA